MRDKRSEQLNRDRKDPANLCVGTLVPRLAPRFASGVLSLLGRSSGPESKCKRLSRDCVMDKTLNLNLEAAFLDLKYYLRFYNPSLVCKVVKLP